MDLILWRHADAVAGYPDAQRQLTEKGLTQAKRTAAWLHARLPEDALILVSPALRAQQTADALKLLGRKLKTFEAANTGAHAADLIAAAGWPDAKRATVIVGHQPTLGEVASLLLACGEGSLSVKKSAVWWFSARGGEGAVLRAVMTPGLL